jgi:hypothetical protein
MSLLGNLAKGVLTKYLQPQRTAAYASTRLAQLPNVVRQSNSAARTFGLTAPAMPGSGVSGPEYVGMMDAQRYRTRKRRRTNPTNVRALRRALSRVEGFIKIEKRVDKILRRVAPKARQAQKVGFVKRRK